MLHPSEAAGGRLTIRHSDGQIEETVFPEAISPDQPAFDISALTHEPAPGVSCTVEMEGDAFEMEDQRNWTDASFKTYIRPLSKPRPYVIAKGEKDRQRITVTIKAPAAAKPAGADADARLTLGAPAGRMPSMALFLDPDELPSALAHAASVGTAQDVIVRFDADRGHDWRTLVQAADFARSIGARLAIEAIFNARRSANRGDAGRRRDQVGKCRAERRPGFTAPRVQDAAIEHAAGRRKRRSASLSMRSGPPG